MQSPCFHELIESIPVIESLFDSPSAGFLTRWSRHPDTAARTLRDLGRLRRIAKGSSPSIREKLRKDPDRALEILAIEEWRLDGLTLALGLRILEADAASALVAALLCLRLGSARQKSAPSLVLHLDRLLKCGLFTMGPDLELGLGIASEGELPLLVEATVNQAMELTWTDRKHQSHTPTFLNDSRILSENALRILEKKIRSGKRSPITPDRFVWS